MRLLAKFNVVLIPLCLLSIWFIGMLSHRFLLDQAREETLERAELMITSASSVRDYTEEQLTPLLSHTQLSRKRFLPQTIPFYAATVTFDSLRQHYPDYTYKEAALNPTNLRDRANDWETDVITYFRNHDSGQLVGERDTPTGRSLYLAHPIRTEPGCLQCHGSPAKAPATLVAAYGRTDGFGWGPQEVVGAQIVSVPMNVPVQIARRGYATLMSYLALTFVVIIAAINIGLYLIVIRPLRRIAAVAERVSRGEQAEAPAVPQGRDEIADVALSVHRLSVSLNKALQMLEPNQQ